jgi:acylphosphatase
LAHKNQLTRDCQNAFLLDEHISPWMKLQITIIGPKVHDVGYRYFLMSMAMAQRIRMFEAHNLESVMGEEVLVLVDGGEQEVKAFRALVETKRPERAEVSKSPSMTMVARL